MLGCVTQYSQMCLKSPAKSVWCIINFLACRSVA